MSFISSGPAIITQHEAQILAPILNKAKLFQNGINMTITRDNNEKGTVTVDSDCREAMRIINRIVCNAREHFEFNFGAVSAGWGDYDQCVRTFEFGIEEKISEITQLPEMQKFISIKERVQLLYLRQDVKNKKAQKNPF